MGILKEPQITTAEFRARLDAIHAAEKLDPFPERESDLLVIFEWRERMARRDMEKHGAIYLAKPTRKTYDSYLDYMEIHNVHANRLEAFNEGRVYERSLRE